LVYVFATISLKLLNHVKVVTSQKKPGLPQVSRN